MTINTREELINALVAAAELEHALMVQYLYAEMTLKDGTDGLPAEQWAKVKNWGLVIAGVARQEMGHLATVLNLLEAIGGGSHLNRMRLPSASGLYKPPIPFGLEPLTQETIDRFVRFETPAHPVEHAFLAPEPVIIQHVGQLYSDIEAAVMNFSEAELFIGHGAGQDQATWGFSITVTPVTDRDSAKAAINSIITEGEGNSTGSDDSHYGRFKKIRNEYKVLADADPAFCPYRSVLSNPATLDARDTGATDTSIITNADTKDAAELFNACYTTLLIVLVKYYRFDENTDNQDSLQGIAKSLMIRVLRLLGPLLSRLPATENKNAGPPFEIYTLPSLPYERGASLTVIRERLEIEQAFANALAPRIPLGETIQKVASALGDIAATVPA